MLALESLDIARIVVHHIPKAVGRVRAAAACSDNLVELPRAGLDMFSRRIAGALGSRSKGIRVDIKQTGADSFFQLAAQAMSPTMSDERFILHSKAFAEELCKAQGIKGLNESKLLVMSGVAGEFRRPFLAVVKADMQDALAELPNEDGASIVNYLDNIFLADSHRLFKIGFLQQNVANPRLERGLRHPDDFSMHLFDHLLTATETRSAAHYFYADFLGTDVAASDRRLTQDFYEKTLRFLESRQYDAEVLIEKSEALRTELRTNDATISVADFARRNLDPADGDEYAEYMKLQSFPEHAITKDIEYIRSKIRRRRKFVFSSKVMITAPADGEDLVEVSATEDGKTIVSIAGTLTKSE